MSFYEKSNWVMVAVMGLVYGGYFAKVLPAAFSGQITTLQDVQMLMLSAVVFLIVFSILAHIFLAALAPSDSDDEDERDKTIRRMSDSRALLILSIACVGALAAALMGLGPFWMAQIILGGLVVSDICSGLMRAWAYRFGV